MNVQNLARASTFPQPNGPVRVQSGSLIHIVDGLPLRLVNELEHGRNLGNISSCLVRSAARNGTLVESLASRDQDSLPYP
jgi:hypothetical protein